MYGMATEDMTFQEELAEALENTQPEYWCGARPCGDCDETESCILFDPPEINVIGILKHLNEYEGRKKYRAKKKNKRNQSA